MSGRQLKRGGNWIAPAREVGRYPNAYVSVTAEGCVQLVMAPGAGSANYVFQLDRRLARLVAKRITECLEATR